jgi:hypothetical protein
MTTFSVARMPIKFSCLGAGRRVRESDMDNLGDILDRSSTLQHVAFVHLKLGRTTEAGQVHRIYAFELDATLGGKPNSR